MPASASEESRPSVEEYKARQRRAEVIPLQVGTELAWTGSSLEPGSHPPSDYPHDRSISPSPLRRLESRLLDPREGVAAQPWRLELVEPLHAGTYRYSQIWRAIAAPRDEDARIPVVLKLYQESLFPYWRYWRERGELGLHTAKTVRQAESYAYSVARDLQGSDIPLCYGFYPFQQPSGEVSIGTCAALRLQNRLHEFGIKHALCDLDQFVLLQSSADQSVRSWTLVGLGFSRTVPKPEDDEVDEADEKEIRNGTTGHPWWNEWDQDRLIWSAMNVFDPFDEAFDDLARDWCEFELKHERLDFLSMHYDIPTAQQRQPERSEGAREDQLKLDARLKGLFEQYGPGL
ncbi:uncharacterized protein JCM15063_003121 [Sporobolomyces koalae]|uniref:uncharacterized protein n=1 Tax=Sporobolomyces koalae TaxID=500713 RepID=UPI00316BE576